MPRLLNHMEKNELARVQVSPGEIMSGWEQVRERDASTVSEWVSEWGSEWVSKWVDEMLGELLTFYILFSVSEHAERDLRRGFLCLTFSFSYWAVSHEETV